jgi:cell division protein FtsL
MHGGDPMKRKKQYTNKNKRKQMPTSFDIWKVIFTIVGGITAIIVLFITVTVVVKPYYEMQTSISELTKALHENKETIDKSHEELDEMKNDISIITRAVHILLLSSEVDESSKDEIKKALESFENDVVYGANTTADSGNYDGDYTQESIQEITQRTLDALSEISK